MVARSSFPDTLPYISTSGWCGGRGAGVSTMGESPAANQAPNQHKTRVTPLPLRPCNPLEERTGLSYCFVGLRCATKSGQERSLLKETHKDQSKHHWAGATITALYSPPTHTHHPTPLGEPICTSGLGIWGIFSFLLAPSDARSWLSTWADC